MGRWDDGKIENENNLENENENENELKMRMRMRTIIILRILVMTDVFSYCNSYSNRFNSHIVLRLLKTLRFLVF